MSPPTSLSHTFTPRWLRRFVGTLLLLGLVLLRGPKLVGPVAISASSISGCLANLAGKFTSGWDASGPAFQWYKFLGEHTFATTDILRLSFAVVPFDSGNTVVALDEIDGRTGYGLSFQGGLVNGVVPYTVNGWNSVEAEFNFDTKQYTLTVNGVSSAPLPFDFSDSDSVQALRIHSFDASTETSAWFDSISVVKSSGGDQTALFTATFDNGATYSASYGGTITSVEPPDDYLVPATCTSEPMFAVSPAFLEFNNGGDGSNLDSQVISIDDNGVTPVSWTADESVSWLSLGGTQGTTPAEIEVSVDIDGLDPGVYAGQITVSSDDVEQGRSQTVYVSLTVYSGSSSAGRPCPEDFAGKFVTGWDEGEPAFQWYKSFGEHTFATTDILRLSFAVVPFRSGQTCVGMDEISGRSGYALHFFDGVIYGADHGNGFINDTPLATYKENAWNSVQVEYDFASHQYTLAVNGAVTGPFPFKYSDSNSVQALRVHSFDVDKKTFAWFDSFSIVKSSGEGQTTLFTATFDDGTTYSASYGGTITSLEPPDDYLVPAECTSEPVLAVSPGVLSFSAFEGGSNPASQFITINGDNIDTMSWSIGESISWLSLSSAQGTTPAAVEVSVDISSLDHGEYNGPVTIVSDEATTDPQTVDVRLLVNPSEAIELSAQPGYDTIRLDWNATNDPYVTAYPIFRAISQSQDFTQIAVISDTNYLDNDPALTSGTEYCYYVAALRSDDSLAKESNVACTVFGQVELWIPDIWAAPGQTMVVPLNIRNAAGLSIAASDIWLNFDGTVIEVIDISETSLTDGYTWDYAIQSTSTYSQARISAFGSPTMLHGVGSLFWLTVRVIGSVEQESPLDLQEFVDGVGGTAIYTPDDLSRPIPMQLEDGIFHVADGSALGDLNGNGVIQAVDAYIALEIASGEITPFTEQLFAGDDNGNGEVEAGDASMILYYAVHEAWPTLSLAGMTAEDVTNCGDPVLLSLDSVRGKPGEVVQLLLRAENLSDWAGGEFLVVYDPGVVEDIVDVEAAGLGSGFAVQYHDDGTGLLRIALADGAPTSGSGALATISLQIASAPFSSGSTPLNLAEAHLNDLVGRDFATSVMQRAIVRHSGELRIGTECRYLPLILKRR